VRMQRMFARIVKGDVQPVPHVRIIPLVQRHSHRRYCLPDSCSPAAPFQKKKKKKKKNLLPARSHHAAAWCLQLDSCCCTCSIGFSCRSPASAVLRTAIDHPPASAAQLSPECQDLLARMLRPMPHERATLQEVAEHPWLASARPCLPPLVVNDRLVRSFH